MVEFMGNISEEARPQSHCCSNSATNEKGENRPTRKLGQSGKRVGSLNSHQEKRVSKISVSAAPDDGIHRKYLSKVTSPCSPLRLRARTYGLVLFDFISQAVTTFRPFDLVTNFYTRSCPLLRACFVCAVVSYSGE